MCLKRISALAIFLWSCSAYSLVSSDVLRTSLVKVYENNIVAINRGLEDGIFKGDHIMLTSSNGFIARGVSVGNSMRISYIQLYRVVRPELVSKDVVYKLTSLNQSKLAEELAFLRDPDYRPQIKPIPEDQLEKQLKLQQERIVKFDLPEKIQAPEEPDELNAFVGRNFDKQKFKSDFKTLYFSVYASPISWQTRDNQRSVNYGFSLDNRGQKYELSLNYRATEHRTVDPISSEAVDTESKRADAFFDINKITPDWTYFAYASYYSAMNGQIRNPGRMLSGGLMGFKRHIVDKDFQKGVYKLDLSYITLFEVNQFDSLDERFNDDTLLFDTIIEEKEEQYLRHALRFRLFSAFSRTGGFNLLGWWKPRMELDTLAINLNDTQTNILGTFYYSLTENFKLDYTYQYTYDQVQKREYGIDPENIINSVNLRYNFAL